MTGRHWKSYKHEAGDMEREFEDFWLAKPRRKGSNPKEPARIKFLRAIANGTDPQLIIGAARARTKQHKDDGNEGTEFVPMAVTWLNQKRFNDYEPIDKKDFSWHDAIAAKHGLIWNGERYVPKESVNAA